MPLSKQMTELLMQVCAEKNIEKKRALLQQLKLMLDQEAELLRAQQAREQSGKNNTTPP